MVIWIIGLAGAGKTTIAKALYTRLKTEDRATVMLDGDAIREIFAGDLGFTLEDRRRNGWRICQMCKYLDDQGINVVCATLSQFHEQQDWNRENFSQYFEVYLEVDMNVLIRRDQKGLYSADPRKDPNARFIDVCTAGDPDLEQMAGGAGSRVGTGGMITKVIAARRAAGSGASTVIAWGREPDVLVRLTQGEAIGTLFVAETAKVAARKQWMMDHLQLRGAVVIDDGAVAKVRDEGASLLPIGVTEVVGDFQRGDVIAVRDGAGNEVARGLANYASTEARLIQRKPSSEFEALLGFTGEAEMIHRDNLVLE